MLALILLVSCETEGVTLVGDSIGSCTYISPFSGETECRDFYETDEATAVESCDGVGAPFQPGVACAIEDDAQGTCTWAEDAAVIRATVLLGEEASCGNNRFGCETFANGVWEPGSACGGSDELVVLDDPFPMPELVCVDPLPGEPEGSSEDGQVCTWQIVSGATEEGRSFSDYASCDVVVRQRGYAPVPANSLADTPDPRMDDPSYTAELDWVRGQVRAGSCDCCHSSAAPQGAAVFDADFEGNMANQFTDRGLAMGAGWIPTVGFGTYAPEDNNGFERSSLVDPYLSIFPTTDQGRMMAFFESELEHRGLKPEDFEGDSYGAGPLDTQLYYEPEACSSDEGIDANGLIRWLPGRARYIYVLEKGSLSPTVPPNLDLPEGLIWRVDLPADGSPVSSETVTYGEVPAGMTQVYPAEGAPAPLETGKEYYLYVTADVLYPISRCVFVAGAEAEAEGGCSSTGSRGPAGAAGLLTSALLAGALARRRARR